MEHLPLCHYQHIVLHASPLSYLCSFAMCLIYTDQPTANHNRPKSSWSMNHYSQCPHSFCTEQYNVFVTLSSSLRAAMRLLWKIIYTHKQKDLTFRLYLHSPAKKKKSTRALQLEKCWFEGITEVSLYRHVCGQNPVLFADNISPLWGEENQRKQSRWVKWSKSVIKHVTWI